jgi:TRAP transporter TAXI family solute receptor
MTFKPLGDALVSAYRRVLPDVNFVVVGTEGSVSNLDLLQAGTADLGLALSDAAYMAYNGHIAELHGPTRAIRGVAVLHASTVHVLVSKDSVAKSIADLRGMRIGVGASGSGTAVTTAMLLRAFGVPSDDVRQRTMQFQESVRALTNGDLDAVFIAVADPVAARLAVVYPKMPCSAAGVSIVRVGVVLVG